MSVIQVSTAHGQEGTRAERVVKQPSLDRLSIESLVATDVVLAKLAKTFLAPLEEESARERKKALRDRGYALFDRLADECHGSPTEFRDWWRKWLRQTEDDVVCSLRKRGRFSDRARFA